MYMFLLVGCCIATLYPAFGPGAMGFTALLWGLLGAGMALWMLERVQDYRKAAAPSFQNAKALPDALIYKMRRQSGYSRGIRATKSFAIHNIYLLIALFMYLAWGTWTTAYPVIPPALYDLHDQILYVFGQRADFDRETYHFISQYDVILRNMLPLLVLVIIFWLGQVFGHSSRAGEVLVWLCFGLFMIFVALLFTFSAPVTRFISADIWYGYGWGRSAVLQALEVMPRGDLSALQRRFYALGIPGVILGYIPGVIVTLLLLRNAFTKASPKIKVVAGLLVLCVLLVVDGIYPVGAIAFGLHLAAWSALSFLTIRGRTDVRKIYRLYQ